MTRLSGNEYRDGRVWNGFDYALQVWVVNGLIQSCAHPPEMRRPGFPCCTQHELAGLRIDRVEGAERRWCTTCRRAATAACTTHLHALS